MFSGFTQIHRGLFSVSSGENRLISGQVGADAEKASRNPQAFGDNLASHMLKITALCDRFHCDGGLEILWQH